MNIIRACIALKPPKGGSKMQCPKFEQQATITPKRYEIWCQLVLITNRKSHTVYGYRLIPSSWPWMTLNGVIALILLFSPNSIALLANYVTVVEDRPITSAEYCSPIPVPVFHFGPKVTHRGWLLLVLTHTAARSLCRSWATCIFRAQLHARRIWNTVPASAMHSVVSMRPNLSYTRHGYWIHTGSAYSIHSKLKCHVPH